MMPGKLKLAFYGDDFTGSTDALEVLSFAGLRVELFLRPPEPRDTARISELDAVGIAGDSRAMAPDEMSAELPSVFQNLRSLNAPIIHYKVCSTFDSSPALGSIGRVIEIARSTLNSNPVPIVGGTPSLGRYCIFGNLFARSGTDNEVYRIDRHPIMSVHPATPMGEADLAVHIGRQGRLSIGKLTFPFLDQGFAAARARIESLKKSGSDAIIYDMMSLAQAAEVGRLLDSESDAASPLFVVGPSGVEYALTQWWRREGRLSEAPPTFERVAAASRVLAVSGSASKLTDIQIASALTAGFVDIPVNSAAVTCDEDWQVERAGLLQKVLSAFADGRSAILHTARGPDDPRIDAMIERYERLGHNRESAKHAGGRLLGNRLGQLVNEIMKQVRIGRLLLSGGDTSSQIMKMLEMDSLTVAARFAAGVPLCRATSASARIDKLEVALKGGQLGNEMFFVLGRDGFASAS